MKHRKLLTYALIAILAWATPAIAATVYTTVANVFTANQRINAALGINAAPGATGTITLSSSIFERSRSTALGEWTAIAYNSSNFSGNGAMTWTVDNADQVSLKYTLVGKTMMISFEINNTDVGGTANTQLRINLPPGFTVNGRVKWPCLIVDNGTATGGIVTAPDLGTTINITREDTGNFTLTSSDNTSVQGSIAFEFS